MKTKIFGAKEFRLELEKIMPGYQWTVSRQHIDTCLNATGIQSSGFNRLSTLQINRREHDDCHQLYEVLSAGNGTKTPWLNSAEGKTLASALRSLQDIYESEAAKYRNHASALERGRKIDGDGK